MLRNFTVSGVIMCDGFVLITVRKGIVLGRCAPLLHYTMNSAKKLRNFTVIGLITYAGFLFITVQKGSV